jgi:hypothetical protein
MTPSAETRHFFVDEAGDLTLFGKGGRVAVGEQGVSKVFMVGVAQIPDPSFADALLGELRIELLTDPYFKGVPSMQLAAGKTARAFHASKDLPEVRRDVIARLSQTKAKVFVAIRRKDKLVEEMRRPASANRKQLTLRNLYDDLVARLFRNVLHQAERNEIVFAKHATWTRREALALAIKRAKANFERAYGLPSDKPTDIRAAQLHEFGGLQVVDYFLWALQRMYERGEDRFFELLRPGFRLIMDLDDTRDKDYGEWYSDENPLTLKKMMPPAG